MKHKKREKSKLKRILYSVIVLYFVVCLSTIGSDYKSFAFLYYMFLPSINRIHANLQVSTGPMFYIDDNYTKKMLKKIYPDIDTYDIELVGNTPYKYVDDPAEIGDVTVYGKFDGVTKIPEIGYIPVFKVKYYDDFYKVETIIRMVILIIMSLLFIVTILIWLIHYFSRVVRYKTIKKQRQM